MPQQKDFFVGASAIVSSRYMTAIAGAFFALTLDTLLAVTVGAAVAALTCSIAALACSISGIIRFIVASSISGIFIVASSISGIFIFAGSISGIFVFASSISGIIIRTRCRQ